MTAPVMAGSPSMLPSQDAVRFKTSAALVWLLRFLAVACLGIAGLMGGVVGKASSLAEGGLLLFGALFFAGFAVFGWKGAGRLRDQFAVDETGLWRLPPKGNPVFIAWHDVGVVRADDTMQRLIVSDRFRAHSIRIEYQSGDFSALRDFIVRHTDPATRAKRTAGSVFYRTWINKGVLLFVTSLFVAAAAWSFSDDAKAPSAIFLAMAGVSLAGVARDPLSLAIKSDRFVVRYPGWKRDILFRDIASVTLKNVAANGDVWAGVVISVKDRKSLTLYRFRDGSLALLHALQSALGPASSPEKTTQIV